MPKMGALLEDKFCFENPILQEFCKELEER